MGDLEEQGLEGDLWGKPRRVGGETQKGRDDSQQPVMSRELEQIIREGAFSLP